MKIKDIIKKLEQLAECESQDYELIYDMFTQDAVRNQAKHMEITLTDAQVSEIIKYIENNTNAMVGVNRETIEDAINDVTGNVSITMTVTTKE